MLIVVVAVDVGVIVVQVAVPRVITIVLRRGPKVGVVTEIVEITIIVVTVPARQPGHVSSRLNNHIVIFRGYEEDTSHTVQGGCRIYGCTLA